MGTIPPTARVNQIRYAPRRHGQEIRQSASRTPPSGNGAVFQRHGDALSHCRRRNCSRSWPPWSRHPDSTWSATTACWPPMPTTGRTSCQGPKCRTRQRIRRATTAHPPRHSDATDCRGLSCWRACSTLSSAYVERCGGTVKVVAALTEPGAIRKYLPGVGLPARAPPMAPAGRQPQQEFDIDYAASTA